MTDTQTPGRLDRVLALAAKPPTISGRVLRLERQAAFVTVTALARQIGISRQRLNTWERGERSPEQAARYRAALAELAKGR